MGERYKQPLPYIWEEMDIVPATHLGNRGDAQRFCWLDAGLTSGKCAPKCTLPHHPGPSKGQWVGKNSFAQVSPQGQSPPGMQLSGPTKELEQYPQGQPQVTEDPRRQRGLS